MSRRRNDPLRALTSEERATLEQVSRAPSAPAVQVTRAKQLLAVAAGASYIAAARTTGRRSVGDVRDIGNGKRLNTTGQQKVSGWSHGKQVDYLSYKLAAAGIALERQSEAYSSKTCHCCGRHNKPNGRRYRCSGCGFVGHRDAVGASNQVSKAVHSGYGHVQPRSVKYRRPFRRRSTRDTGHVARLPGREAAPL